MAGGDTYRAYQADRDKVEFQLHVGSETIPQYPIRSLAEFAYHLEKALDLTASVEGVSISAAAYRTDAFIIGLDVRPARDRAAARSSRAWTPASAAAATSGSR